MYWSSKVNMYGYTTINDIIRGNYAFTKGSLYLTPDLAQSQSMTLKNFSIGMMRFFTEEPHNRPHIFCHDNASAPGHLAEDDR